MGGGVLEEVQRRLRLLPAGRRLEQLPRVAQVLRPQQAIGRLQRLWQHHVPAKEHPGTAGWVHHAPAPAVVEQPHTARHATRHTVQGGRGGHGVRRTSVPTHAPPWHSMHVLRPGCTSPSHPRPPPMCMGHPRPPYGCTSPQPESCARGGGGGAIPPSSWLCRGPAQLHTHLSLQKVSWSTSPSSSQVVKWGGSVMWHSSALSMASYKGGPSWGGRSASGTAGTAGSARAQRPSLLPAPAPRAEPNRRP